MVGGCSTSHAALFSDDSARLSLLDLKSRINDLNEKSIVSICSKNNPIANQEDERLGDVGLNKGDKEARKAIKDLRVRVINLEASCEIPSKKFISIPPPIGFFFLAEDDSLRREILVLRGNVNTLEEKIKKQVMQKLKDVELINFGSETTSCKGTQTAQWNNCVGTLFYPNGAKHTGEFRYGEKFGRGIEYDHRGDVSRDGYWSDHRFFKDIDTFKIALSEQKTPPTNAELLRLQAEAEEAKRKQSELENELRHSQQPVTQQSSQSNTSSRNSKRIALVIGNAAYISAPLKNPLNDAADISTALRQSGFEVIDQRNATLQEMTRGIREFGDKLLKSDVGLVYYSGHGLEVKGRNYLLPVNASMIREDEIAFQAIDANLILEKMNTAKKSVNILIVDACRDNPFARSFRSVNRGLAQMDAPTGTIVSFSTSPGKTASDGDGRNSPFTKNLVKAMMRTDMPIEAMFKEVRKSVVEETKGQQTPWESSSLIGDFYFKASK
jgi:hypothetical protein